MSVDGIARYLPLTRDFGVGFRSGSREVLEVADQISGWWGSETVAENVAAEVSIDPEMLADAGPQDGASLGWHDESSAYLQGNGIACWIEWQGRDSLLKARFAVDPSAVRTLTPFA